MTTDGRLSSFSLHHWLMLAHADIVPPQEIFNLLREHGSPSDALSSGGLGRISSLPSGEFNSRIKRCLEWSKGDGNHAICLGSESYPQSLIESRDPPVVLFASGDVDLLSRRKLLVIGEDKATVEGAENARRISKALADNEVCIATGESEGIEAAVRKGIADAMASSIELVGSIFGSSGGESRNRKGLTLYGGSFPRRGANPEVAAYEIGVNVADACLVVEANFKSRTLEVAQYALESGKEVFAMPGSINSPNYRGCHRLIRDGAHLIVSYEDVLEILGEKAGSRYNRWR